MNAQSTNTTQKKHLATIENTAKHFQEAKITPAAIRAYIFNSEDRYSASGEKIPGNGLVDSGAIIRIGRKILIDIDRFDAWLASKTTNKINQKYEMATTGLKRYTAEVYDRHRRTVYVYAKDGGHARQLIESGIADEGTAIHDGQEITDIKLLADG